MNEKVNNMISKLIDLREKAKETQDPKDEKEYRKCQSECTKSMMGLVNNLTSRYKKFSNYLDLKQDGLEALLSAYETYKPTKGDFTWWATKYIKTKVSRNANKHSTIKIPLKKAKDLHPYKVSTIPILIDGDISPLDKLEKSEVTERMHKAVSSLPDVQRQVVTMMFYETAEKDNSIMEISKKLNITRNTCSRILEEAKQNLRNILTELGE